MGLGIAIKKPEHKNSDMQAESFLSTSSEPSLSPLYILMMGLTFLSALVALYFLFQSRSV